MGSIKGYCIVNKGYIIVVWLLKGMIFEVLVKEWGEYECVNNFKY